MRNRIVVAVLVVASSACMKSFERYHAKEVEIEAKIVTQNIAIALRSGYVDRKAMCPSPTPVPADIEVVKEHPYESKVGDWDDSWKCVFDTENLAANPIDVPRQHFQYSVVVSPDKQTAVITAKGYSGGPTGGLHTLTRTCTGDGESVKCGELEGGSK